MTYTEKLVTGLPPVEVVGRWFKRYHVTSETAPITADIERAALGMLPTLLPKPDGTPPAGFIVLFRGEDGAAYLIAYTWVWDNVLQVRSAAAGQPVLSCPDDDPTHFMVLDQRWVGSVYELAPLGHERDAWIRHMLAPDVPDLDGYLADQI